ncbi:hypothetical protein HNY73_000199 [Argiope bruennichi]|uniref:Uncharacterized protein n=1 Tax=Argiope bruennichi TaxID=94029 RepID=A0A8T0FYA3_ARGBR|nr:hypothetical protein HNY73_000199 [Argiope bruennichi]
MMCIPIISFKPKIVIKICSFCQARWTRRVCRFIRKRFKSSKHGHKIPGLIRYLDDSDETDSFFDTEVKRID